MKKIVLILTLTVIPILRLSAQSIQGTLRQGSTLNEVYLTIRNNTSANITGNVTKIEFTLGMYLESPKMTNAFGFTDIYTLPTPSAGIFSSHDYMSMLSSYLAASWTGSKAVSLSPGQEMDLIGFTLWGVVGPELKPGPFTILSLRYRDPFFGEDKNWLVELDGVNVTEGNEKFYSQGSNTTVHNEFSSAYLNLSTFNLTNLPVTLTKFEGRHESDIVNLNWATTEETNSDHFDIEHSLNGKSWRSIGTVAALGQSAKLHEYSFQHKNPEAGAHYYRLKMIDIDQTFAFSKIVNVNVGDRNSAGLFPNPTMDKVFFKATDLGNVSKVQVLNTAGKVLHEASSVDVSGLDVRHLPSGLFIVKLSKADGEVIQYKLIKK
ncbi:MAG: T9SS type A sorting domain-containing protein [Dyadobacter sp.]|uniref:T9SS type A sorting domain-containing protein n=1 Tax=Dyadobacter sp. TaxID=1914288 RepID=UPI00326720CF